MAGNMVAHMELEKQLITLHPDLQIEKREIRPGMGFWNLKVHPQWHTSSNKTTHSNTSQNNYINWGPRFQIYEPVRAILILTTTRLFCFCSNKYGHIESRTKFLCMYMLYCLCRHVCSRLRGYTFVSLCLFGCLKLASGTFLHFNFESESLDEPTAP